MEKRSSYLAVLERGQSRSSVVGKADNEDVKTVSTENGKP